MGENHSDIGIAYGNMASVYLKDGDFRKAKEYRLKSIRIFEKSIGEDHPTTAVAYNNMGLLLLKENKLHQFWM